MSEDTTKNLDRRSFEERVLAEFAAMRSEFAAVNTRLDNLDARLTSLEEKVDARLRETRPIWEGVQLRLTNIEARLDDLFVQFRELLGDLLSMRSRIGRLEERVRERPPAA